MTVDVLNTTPQLSSLMLQSLLLCWRSHGAIDSESAAGPCAPQSRLLILLAYDGVPKQTSPIRPRDEARIPRALRPDSSSPPPPPPSTPATHPTSAMASPRLTDRTEPVVVRRAPQTPTMRSRLSAPLRIFILMVLNGFLKASLWSFASNFVPPELGAVTKVPTEGSSWYSAEARLLINLGTILLNWYFGYDGEQAQSV
jgi:hypothetical protein